MPKTRPVRLLTVLLFTLLAATILASTPSAGSTRANSLQELKQPPAKYEPDLPAKTFTPAREEDSAAGAADSNNVKVLGHIGGALNSLAVQGDYAYVGEGPALAVLDISNPANPVVLGKTAALPDLIRAVAVTRDYAYVADGEAGLRIINIVNPASPKEVGFYDNLGNALNVAVDGIYAYVADEHNLRIINVANPTAPVEVGLYGMPGIAYDLHGGYAYVADDYAGLRIINIADPAAPTQVGVYDTPGRAWDVSVDGGYAYVADVNGGLRIINVTNPAAPTEVGYYDTPGQAWGVAVAGSHAYVGDGGLGLRVINIANPATPTEVGFYVPPNSGYVQSVVVAGSSAYVTPMYGVLQIINISNPSAPTEAGVYKTQTYSEGVAVAGGYAYVAEIDTGLHIINVTNPTTPMEVGSFDTPGPTRGVAVAGNYAYVVDGDSLRIIDVGDPVAPTVVGHYETSDHTESVAVAGGYAYVAARYAGLRVINIANPAAPTEDGFYSTPGGARGVVLAGDYAYVASGDAGLRIINIADPTTPTETGVYDTPGAAIGVAVAGGYAYVADGNYGLRIINIANPSAPTEVSFYDTPGSTLHVAVAGGYAYVASADAGLRIINVANPATPTEAGFYDTSDSTLSVAVAGGYAYVSDLHGGMFIMRFTESASTYSIHGKVIDDNNNYLSGATLTLDNGATTLSDANGNYKFDNLPAGTYKLSASLLGYEFPIAEQTVKVPPDQGSVDFTAVGVSIHFERGVDGFQFQNHKSDWGQAYGTFTWDEMRELFGDNAVCRMQAGYCTPRKRAELWWHYAVTTLTSGYCHGFASTSLLLFQGLGAENRNEPQDFMSGAENTFAIDSWYLMRHYVALNQLKQALSPTSDAFVKAPPNDILKQVIDLMQDGSDPPLIGLALPDYKHALVPISVELGPNGVYWMHVYDSNHPVENNVEIDTYIEFDIMQNTWLYDNKLVSLGIKGGDGSSFHGESSIWLLPISKQDTQSEPPWWGGAFGPQSRSSSPAAEFVELSVVGEGHLLVTDGAGKRVGFTKDGFVNEIPGTIVNWLAGGLGIEAEPVYRLPPAETYQVTLDGSTAGGTGVTGIAKFDRGSATIIENIVLSNNSQDSVTISPSKSITYNPSQNQEVNILMATEIDDTEFLIELLGTDLVKDDEMMLEFKDTTSEVVISHADAAASAFSLQLSKLDAGGETRFVNDAVTIAAGDAKIVRLDTWNDQEISICTDQGANGTIDSCETLKNEVGLQSGLLFLPLITR